MLLDEPLIFERGSAGRPGWQVAGGDSCDLPPELRREDALAGMPEVGELEVLRHYLRLSQWNYSAATTFYPLGSCTMKYNPVVNEELARPAGARPAPPARAGVPGAGRARAVRGARAGAPRGLWARCHHAAAGGGGAGRAARHAPRARLPRRPRERAPPRADSRERARDESGELRAVRLRGDR